LNYLGVSNAATLSSTYGLLAFDVLKKDSTQNSTLISVDSRNLTREYYSLEISRLISREIGLNLLNDIKNRREHSTEGKSLINALFIIQCFHPYGIFLSLNRLHIIAQCLLNNSLFSTFNLNDKCQLILTTMKNEKFLPANSGSEYYDVENSFLYSTFNGKPTIPLTLVSIFCALAEECGLKARPLAFPGEVMAQVEQPSNNSNPLIISVFDNKILSLDEINERLADVLDEPLTHPLPLTSIIKFFIRSAQNMINSITRHSTSSLNSYSLYAAVSILKILGGSALPFAFDSMMNIFKEHFSMDRYFFQIFDDIHQIQYNDLNLSSIKEKRRIDSSVKFYVGQIFQHKQYNYWGVICGWDLTCMASTIWQTQMNITNLIRGASQPFYHILANDSSRRYVAEDNINILEFISIENEEEKYSIIQKLCATDDIGRYFQRVDIINGKFIPNIELRNEYPDDFF
jgi:F-box protein 21